MELESNTLYSLILLVSNVGHERDAQADTTMDKAWVWLRICRGLKMPPIDRVCIGYLEETDDR